VAIWQIEFSKQAYKSTQSATKGISEKDRQNFAPEAVKQLTKK
jgi:hypothetical protein